MEKNVKTKGEKEANFDILKSKAVLSFSLSFSVSFHENSITFQDCFKSCVEKSSVLLKNKK